MKRTEKNKAQIESFEKEKEKKIKKEKYSKRFKFFFTLIILLSLAFVSLRYIGTSGLVVREYVYSSANTPDSFRGAKIVHFGDLHYGHSTDLVKTKEVVAKINQLRPDIVVFTGDLIDKSTSFQDADALTVELSKIDAKYAKYMVLGNHDKKAVNLDVLTGAGFIDLNNNYDLIYMEDNSKVLISGVGDSILKRDDLASAMAYFGSEEADADIFTIAMAHEPDTYLALQDYPLNIFLAGHSHNGQIRLPFIGALKTVVGAEVYKEAFYQESNTSIYITGGIGTTFLPFRLFNHPSINLIRID